ncbi:MAG: ATP-binding protein [Endomicrobium sp.]|jgi:predicted AAA+ superfamily ATPase|nr:ATP-binding protein [Endomicrobium sp.]
MFKRDLQSLVEKWLFKDQVIIVYGARQVGKTTLCKQILEKFSTQKRTQYFDCEMLSLRASFETTNNVDDLQRIIGDKELIVLDEAQLVQDIGKTLKIIHDHIPQVQVIATGSSSFDLANKLSEPLTGRALTFTLYPYSVGEIAANIGYLSVKNNLENLLIRGGYPRIFDKSKHDAEKLLDFLAGTYLYKDVLIYEGLKKSSRLLELLQLLALQVGNEVSYNEIGKQLGMNHTTVSKYIDLLEKRFVIFKLRAFSRNKRKEIAKSVKVYFFDLGIRNNIIQSFAPLNVRNDVGALWENFCIIERFKYNQIKDRRVNAYFYRTYSKEEVDYIEEYDEKLEGYEFKFTKDKVKSAKEFLSSYKNSSLKVINKDNWADFLL